MNEDYIGMENVVEVRSILSKDGYWIVDHKVTYRRSKDLLNWEDKTISMQARSKDINQALSDALLSVAYYLDSHDLFEDEKEEKQLESSDTEEVLVS